PAAAAARCGGRLGDPLPSPRSARVPGLSELARRPGDLLFRPDGGQRRAAYFPSTAASVATPGAALPARLQREYAPVARPVRALDEGAGIARDRRVAVARQLARSLCA